MAKQKDNSTFARKVSLRRLMLEQVAQPVVMETHGGYGRLYLQVYPNLQQGIVFEKDEHKAGVLAEQRPTWAVYQGDCVAALKVGVGAHRIINVLDIDPYGEPWSVMDAFFTSDRPRANTLYLVVNDGLRNKLKLGGAWSMDQMAAVVERYGNNLYHRYLDVCQELVQQKAAQAGYGLSRFAGYYCGTDALMTHYLAVLTR